MDPMDSAFRFAWGFMKGVWRLFVKCWKIGIGWFVTGLFFDWVMHGQYKEGNLAPDADKYAASLGSHIFWFWGVAVGGTALHFINRAISKRAGKKTNLFFWLFEKIFKREIKAPQGVRAKLSGEKEPHGVIYAREKGRYLLQDEDAPGSVAVFGTPGSGKSQGIFIPTLLSYGSKSVQNTPESSPSVFVVDIKGELLQASYKYRSGVLGRSIKYLSFGDEVIPDKRPSKYDPFAIMDFVENDIQGVTEIANALIPKAKNDSNPYFVEQARTLLAGLLYSMYKHKQELTFAECLQLICSAPIADLIETYCIGTGTQAAPDCVKGWMLLSSFYTQAKQEAEAESFANVRDTMLGPLRLIATNDNIINAFDTSSGDVVKPQDLITGDVYICIKEQYLNADEPNILNLIVAQFLSYFSRFENNTNKRILFMLDEFPRLGELKKVTEGVNLYRSKGIRFLIAAQSIDQIKEKYGQDHFGVLMDGMGTTLVLRAVGSSAEYFSKRVGKYDKTVKGKNTGVSAQSMQFGQGMNSGLSESEQERDVFRPSYFENELAANKRLLILAPNGYKEADVCFAYNDKVFSDRI
jgi:type IV secretory pathway TraG/TraD family ATPase VirD4